MSRPVGRWPPCTPLSSARTPPGRSGSTEYGQCISFQQVESYTPPRWPAQEVPQQMHLDVIVDDLDAAETAVLDLGATKHEHQPGTSFRVFLDPAGHPFCLCVD